MDLALSISMRVLSAPGSTRAALGSPPRGVPRSVRLPERSCELHHGSEVFG
jgi:hypothetical protein